MIMQDYIKKHGLKLWKTWPNNDMNGPWVWAVFTDLPDEKHETSFDIYRNDDGTRFVSVNQKQGKFRIIHRDEIVQLSSEWLNINTNHIHADAP